MSPERASEVLDMVSFVRCLRGLCYVYTGSGSISQVVIVIHKLSVAMILMQEVLAALRSIVAILTSETVCAA